GVQCFHGQKTVAPLKLRIVASRGIRPGRFHGQKTVAPLKPTDAIRIPTNAKPRFHGQKTVAPLKLALRSPLLALRQWFPRSKDRGPIEAENGTLDAPT